MLTGKKPYATENGCDDISNDEISPTVFSLCLFVD